MFLLCHNHKNGNDTVFYDSVFRQPIGSRSIVALPHREHTAYCFGCRPDYRQNVARDCEALYI